MIDEFRAAPGDEFPAGYFRPGLNPFLCGLLGALAEILQHGATGEKQPELAVVGEHGIEIETGSGGDDRFFRQSDPRLASFRLGTPAAVFARRWLFRGVVIRSNNLLDGRLHLPVGEPDSHQFALVAEEQVCRPFGCEMRLHQAERIGCHLLSVVPHRAGLEIGMGKLVQE